jgi:hypothetical protein
MAAREHSCTRRALLGAAALLPLPLRGRGWGGVAVGLGDASPKPRYTSESTPTLPSPLKGEGKKRKGRWQRALAALRAAEGEMRAAEQAGSAGAEERSFEQQWELDETFSDRVVEFKDAVQRLLLAPAPDLPALAAKLALFGREQAWELPRGEECMGALQRDALRLCEPASK